MALVRRIANLFKADVHGILDKLEEPLDVLKAAVRDMEEELVADEHAITALIERSEALELKAKDIDALLGEFGPQLDICLAAGNDALARTIIRKRLEVQKRKECCARELKSLELERERAGGRLAERRSALAGFRAKMELASQCGRSENRVFGHEGVLEVSEADVEVAFLQEKQRHQAACGDAGMEGESL